MYHLTTPLPVFYPRPVMMKIQPARNISLPKAPPLVNNEKWYYTSFLDAVDSDRIDKVVVFQDKKLLEAHTKDGISGEVILPIEDKDVILDRMIQHHVAVRYEEKQGNDIELNPGAILVYGVFLLVGFSVLKSLGGGGNGMTKFGKSNAKYQETPETGVTFEDVAGVDNAVQDLKELVDFLKTPEKYAKFGAKIPRGCLLVGNPGTGKSLLARAVAGEAGVPFFSCSASSFVEMFVGVGASRVRDLFKDAKKKAPCIIFIDEIDAVGKSRSDGKFGPGNDERDQTINQLLTEMDGFEGSTGVIVMAATNRPDVLDPALLRPGRFDRQITVDNPDFKGRVAILKIHTKNKLLAEGLDIDAIAKGTTGMSGADLENLANEAAITAARNSQEFITQPNFDEAFDKILLGPERKTMIISENKRRLVAVHESGHALLSLKIGEYDLLTKVTIIPRAKSGGVTMFEPSSERVDDGLVSKEFLENRICVCLGGRAAEEMVFGDNHVTTGASQDIIEVENIARAMITRYGLSDAFGAVHLTDGRYSQQTAYEIDIEVRNIVSTAYKKTMHILQTNRDLLSLLTTLLLDREVLSGDEVRDMVVRHTVDQKGAWDYYIAQSLEKDVVTNSAVLSE